MRPSREAEISCQIAVELGAEMLFSVSLPAVQYVSKEGNLRWGVQTSAP